MNIESTDGIENLLKPHIVSAELKSSGIEALGLLVDGNGNPAKLWKRIRQHCMEDIPDIPETPEEIPVNGLHLNPPGLPRLGVWIMPDNRKSGMLENFLIDLIPHESRGLLDFARRSVELAEKKGATFKRNHRPKAEIYTWLAWQNPPGKQLHEAVNFEILDPMNQSSAPFVKWFRSLFEV